MDRRISLLLILAVIASGCGDDGGDNKVKPGKVEMTEMKINDKTLRPNQTAIFEASFKVTKSFNTTLDSDNVTLYNLGSFKAKNKECNPSKIEESERYNPSMRCTWEIQAPKESYMDNFQRKSASFNLKYNYSTTVANLEPLELKFIPLGEIEESKRFSRSFGDPGLNVKVEGDKPLSKDRKNFIDIKVTKKGSGDLLGDISMSFNPGSIFTGGKCDELELISGEASAECPVESNLRGTRNAFISASYKYEKTEEIGVEVINK